MNNKYRLKTILIIGLLILLSFYIIWDGKTSVWHGYQRYDFKVDGKKSYVVVPKKVAEGNPWVWRARFPNYSTKIDEILLERGFHIAYMNTDGMLGSPKALKHWDEFYKVMTKQHDLATKVSLEAVSRGGLFAYRWAAQNPDRILSIYADSPVCDFKSWPLGKGIATKNKKVWAKLLEHYNFSEEQALSYNKNPIDVLVAIAKANIPVLHIVSLNDEVVPPTENTFVLAKRYRELGGNIDIIEVEIGPRANGHHFDHPDPIRVANFIQQHATQVP